MTRDDFVEFLRETLIPDLEDSGMQATADDFKIAIEFIEDPFLNEIEDEE